MTEIPGAVCAPAGFSAGAVHCGISQYAVDPDQAREDLTLIVSDRPATVAAVFTTNQVQAAPVIVSKEHLARSAEHRAVIINSRNANACSGERGLNDARRTCELVAEGLALSAHEQVLVCSTGHIGEFLPMDRITQGVRDLPARLSSNESAGEAAARGIMTSDAFPKAGAVEITFPDGATVRLGAIAKGAGMIEPNMATMLAFLTTDAFAPRPVLEEMLRGAVDHSFNRINVDGDCSTNDCVFLLANGASGVTLDGHATRLEIFGQALQALCLRLARLMVEDGEGATKCVRICVTGARDCADAEKVARTISRSQLVKTSWCGNDPNWGRVMDAIGYSGASLDPARISISYNGTPAVRNGERAADLDFSALKQIVSQSHFDLEIDLGHATGSFWLYASDLSPAYVKFNLRE